MPTGILETEATLSAAIKAKVQTNNPDFTDKIGDDWDWLFDSIAEAVIAHIAANILVVGTTVTTCGAGAGSGVFTHVSTS